MSGDSEPDGFIGPESADVAALSTGMFSSMPSWVAPVICGLVLVMFSWYSFKLKEWEQEGKELYKDREAKRLVARELQQKRLDEASRKAKEENAKRKREQARKPVKKTAKPMERPFSNLMGQAGANDRPARSWGADRRRPRGG
mmetsp:Transcript_17962/g.29135  ORF Transcript_17962/g.29135 Transcript_17962/m.29135 type:complete len:143 (-) Transcript_17962:3191-3619(-)